LGLTPNPDVMCNKKIKFGLFLKKALKAGADYIATGHYTRIRQEIINSKIQNLKFKLLAGIDKNKDQSYFLWTLSQEQLKRCLFPIGEYTKPEVRELARKFGLPNAERKDSQGLCFVGKVDFREFLSNYIPEKPGLVVDIDGKVLGAHRGIQFYTIGQRHGIGLGGTGKPYFVVQKDANNNILYVAKGENHPALYTNEIIAKDMHWVSGKMPTFPLRVQARIRYRQSLQPAELIEIKNEKPMLKVKFDEPQRAVAPGQSIVFYSKEELLGGGIIAQACNLSEIWKKANIAAKVIARSQSI
ncbi:MAG: tRNA 2-thiouridine(34) synthase MnmA, partial [Candidatus Paceibacteria bacterium]